MTVTDRKGFFEYVLLKLNYTAKQRPGFETRIQRFFVTECRLDQQVPCHCFHGIGMVTAVTNVTCEIIV